METEGACFAGSVPALLTLNVPLIGLGIYANPAVKAPWLGCRGIVRPPALIFSAASWL